MHCSSGRTRGSVRRPYGAFDSGHALAATSCTSHRQIKRDVEGLLDVVRCFGGARHPAAQSITDALGDVDKDIRLWRFGVQRVAMHAHGDAPTTARSFAAAVALVKPILSSRLGADVVAGPGPGAPRVADASVVLFDEGRAPASTAPRPALLLDLGAGGLADGINSLQGDAGTGERLLEHFVSIRGEGSRAPPMWGLLSLSLETSSCVIYTFFQRSGNHERYAVVIRGVICGLS